MSRIKVLNIKTINQMLEEGNLLRYDYITARVQMLDKNNEILGAVRFDTYINLIRQKKLKRIRSIFVYDLYERS